MLDRDNLVKSNAQDDLAEAIDWLKTKNTLNRYALEYMAETATNDEEEERKLLLILKSVVDG